jgi:hypothetical protein
MLIKVFLKTQCRNLHKKNKSNGSPPNFHHNNLTSKSKDKELAEMSDRIQEPTVKNDQKP